MSLRPGSMIRVATAGGTILLGRLEHVRSDEIRLHGKGNALGVAMPDVVRVDALDNSAAARGKRILAGASSFALALGAYEMFLGSVLGGRWLWPSARTWAVGAVAGAAYGAAELALSRGWRTIYLAGGRC